MSAGGDSACEIHPSYSSAMNKHLYRASELHVLKLAYT